MERAREGCVNLNGGELENDLRHAKDKGRGIIAMMLGEKEKPSAEGWKEFKQGVQMILFLPNNYFIFCRNIYLSYIFQYSRRCTSNHGMRLWLCLLAAQS